MIESTPEEILQLAESINDCDISYVGAISQSDPGLFAGIMLGMQTAVISDCSCEACVIIRTMAQKMFMHMDGA